MKLHPINGTRPGLYAAPALLFLLLWSCGKKAEEDPDVSTRVSEAGPLTVSKGDVVIKSVSLKKGQTFDAMVAIGGTALGLAAEENSASLEIAIVNALGQEQVYDREGEAGGSVSFEPKDDGTYEVVVKVNADIEGGIPTMETEGEASAGDLQGAGERSAAVHGDVLLRGVVALARECKELDESGNIATTKAPDGRYYVQPLIFLGRVTEDGLVEERSGAAMEIRSGEDSIALKALKSMDRKTYRDIYASNGSLSDDEERAVTRLFYQGYFAAAGELYTVDSFRFGGSCADAGSIALAGDIGAVNVALHVVEADLGLDETIVLRPTVQPAFSLYEASDVKLSDWTQCTYDRQTAEPETYNGDAATCKTFSLSDPPYVTLDYLMPSATSDGQTAGLTELSDPTRIIYYGHSYAKAWQQALVNEAEALVQAEAPSVTLSRCLNNGGMVAVPLKADRSIMPLAEFNAVAGDVINLARRAGSHTVLTAFYQGDVSIAGTMKVLSCIPGNGEDCADYRSIDVTLTSCTIKADSGVSMMSIADSYIYPSYFEMSGIIGE